MGDDEAKPAPRPGTSRAEWWVAAVSAALVLSLLGYTLHEAVTRPGHPPVVTLRADTVLETAGGYLVMFTARNVGGETAAALRVRGALRRDTAVLEESTATIDYVPVSSEREGGLYFRRDPRRHALELRAVGFDLP